jgi:hypothetical protein
MLSFALQLVVNRCQRVDVENFISFALLLEQWNSVRTGLFYHQLINCVHGFNFSFNVTYTLPYRSRIHERTISMRFLGIALRVLRLEVYITNQFQTSFV